jgi:hypothetical protein
MFQPTSNQAGVILCEFAFGLALLCSSGWVVQGLLWAVGFGSVAMRESYYFGCDMDCLGRDMDCLGRVHVDGERGPTGS